MSAIGSTLWSAGAALLTFGAVIFIHELGHFLACRRLGIRVERFAFGFGPELLGWTAASGTRFSLCAFPLGGFVKPAGEEPEDGRPGAPDEYFGQPWNRRLVVAAAGPAMNYLLAFAVFTGVVWVKGIPEPGKEAVIGNLMTGWPADLGGLRIGDRVERLDGRELAGWEDLAASIHRSPGREILLAVRRGEERLELRLVPRKDEASGRGAVGILPQPVYRTTGPAEALREGAAQCWRQTRMTVVTIAGKLWKRERPDLAGPVGIVQMVHRAAHSGWEDLLFLIGFISVAVGFFNILPVPLLDGGHAAFYLWEGFSGRRPSPSAVEKVNNAGIAFLLSLLVFATYNDVLRIRSERSARAAARQAARP